MWDKIVSFIYALIINVILFAILIYSFNWLNTSKSKSKSTTIINEVIVDENAVDAEIERLTQVKQAEQQKNKYDHIITESYLEQLSQQEQQARQEIEALKQRRLVEMEALEALRLEAQLAKDN
ncbi:cell envelope integrity protein TolA [Candidatus Marithrix sp. Canyon 246]|uniref:cell envelope integrity protein TolA n=1 Tax=Candidatus Marithrix sp. Canyon 246 TaxID=1827136 RepID=UPI000849FCD4|nr:cell envelope integrity protein TolA [Candidatus Marithrix sp. Canyon 246]